VESALGLVAVEVAGDRATAVRAVQGALASAAANSLGLLLALLWTAGLLPGFLDPSSVAVLLVKPLPRALLLLGKCLGVLLFVAGQGLLCVTGTWVALGLTSEIWDVRYFLCLPLGMLEFTVYFSFSALLAVATRHTAACVFGAAAFWCLAWAANFGRHASLALRASGRFPEVGGGAVEAVYWVLPRPLDAHLVLVEALGAGDGLGRAVDLDTLARLGAWHPALSLAGSAALVAFLLAVACYEFATADY
jgi:hypothetical protein